ncbi:methyltransferase domain-containing protein [Kitasatospora cheerisanensis]|uniref:Protein-L-isoaspartate O-methyltransferase n=1 Tax=Kitasatospora cheerisanensis KCTC 2395 TaxID=1348663 RepID=A0A066ZBT7_9ACTN|nr:methyltransferase domain-containing protein [Kitasatospora cheerisanensis]KDN87771.1 protein-L-isoaspartate O-methyltransferase [Kitasatospora cheerisanensis KCTC 2395]
MTAVDSTTSPSTAEAWRQHLDAEMARTGQWPERSPWIRPAVAALPRDRFAPARLWDWDGHAWQPVDRDTDPARWLEHLFGHPSRPAVTELAGNLPSSSLSAPAVVVDMLDSLLPEPGHRVLELGTGTAWNAALLAHRAGPGLVTSIEVDPRLAAAGASRLRAAGLDVHVRAGDGTAGLPAGAPYDRVIATYAVERIPWPWIEQSAPGGRLVVPWGRLGHVALTVAEDRGSATGWLQGLARFMPDRTGATAGGPERGFTEIRRSAPPGPERRTERDPAELRDWDLLFHLRVVLPEVRVETAADADGVSAWIHDGASSWATLSSTPDGVFVHQGGPAASPRRSARPGTSGPASAARRSTTTA